MKRRVIRHYTDKRGHSPQYKTVALAHTLIFQRLIGLNARSQVLKRLKRNLNEAKDLGYTLENRIPNNQNLNYFVNQKTSQETLELIEHTAEYIHQKNEEHDKLKSVERHRDFQEKSEDGSDSYPEGFKPVMNFLKWKLFPAIKFPRKDILAMKIRNYYTCWFSQECRTSAPTRLTT